jgi:cob(I)alamin adenosyltransferase
LCHLEISISATEELTAEIHRTTFEDRLDRVRTNLHLVFSDLASVQQLRSEQGTLPHQVLRRLESTVRVFRGELQTFMIFCTDPISNPMKRRWNRSWQIC